MRFRRCLWWRGAGLQRVIRSHRLSHLLITVYSGEAWGIRPALTENRWVLDLGHRSYLFRLRRYGR